MTKADMMLKLETVAGIGTITTLNGKPRYNFYPDTFNESGLAIAMRTLYPLMDSGDIETITFVENFLRYSAAYLNMGLSSLGGPGSIRICLPSFSIAQPGAVPLSFGKITQSTGSSACFALLPLIFKPFELK